MGSAEEIRQDQHAQDEQHARDEQDARAAAAREAEGQPAPGASGTAAVPAATTAAPSTDTAPSTDQHQTSDPQQTTDPVPLELEQARVLADERRLRRARAPWTSMVLSLAVVLGIALVLVLIIPRTNQVTQPPVDVTLGARAASEQVKFTPSVPVGLPAGWRPTSVRTTRSTADVITWHVGYQTPDQQYAAVEQGQNAPAAWVRQQTNRAPADGTQEVAGRTWRRYTGGRVAQNSLVNTRGGVTTIVTGTASYDDLALLAGSLQPPG